MRIHRLLVPLLLATAAWAQPAAEDRHARPTLLAETSSASPGETLWLAIDFAIDPEWHTYWPGQNDSGFPLEAKLETSANAEAGGLVWPAPKRYFPTDGILDHVFEERMTVLVPIQVAPGARPGDEVRVDADLTWLVCKTLCLPETAQLSISVPVAEGSPTPNAEARGAFEHARARLPRPLNADDPVQVSVQGDALRLRAIGADRLAFYPLETSRRPRDLAETGEAVGDKLEIRFREGDEPIEGVLEVWRAGDRPGELYEIRWPPKAAEPHPTEQAREPAGRTR